MDNLFAVEDIIRFTQDGNERVGVVEAVTDKEYQVRVYAVEGEDIYPTDESVSVALADARDFFLDEDAGMEDAETEELLKAIEIEIEEELSELMGEDMSAKAVDLQPTEEMAKEAQQGLDWRDEFGRGGTEVGVARARDISNRVNLSEDTVFRMVSFFARHEVDKQATGFNSGEEGYPSAGRIAWALWGGDAGKAWAERKVLEIEGENEPAEKTDGFGLGDFVEYESEGGHVVGKIVDILEPVGAVDEETGIEDLNFDPKTVASIYKIEVYEKQEDGYVPSGIMVEQEAEALKVCDVPKMGVMKRLPRFVGKMKKAEVTEESGIGIVKGYLSVFGNVDLGGDVVKAGAFKRSLDHMGGKTVFMADHGYKTNEVLGVLELEEDERGLKMTGKINLKTDQGRNAFETIKFQTENGVPIGASIGYEPVKYNRNNEGGYDLEEVKLAEGSVTPFPMNKEAIITEATKRYNRANREKRAKLFQTLKR